MPQITYDQHGELRNEMTRLVEEVIEYGDRNEFPNPASHALAVSRQANSVYELAEAGVGDETNYLLDLRRYIGDLKAQLMDSLNRWPHLISTIGICERILLIAPGNEDYEDVLAQLEQLQKIASEHGDEQEFWRPSELEQLIAAVADISVETERDVMLEVREFILDLMRHLEDKRDEWPHANISIVICTIILRYTPYSYE